VLNACPKTKKRIRKKAPVYWRRKREGKLKLKKDVQGTNVLGSLSHSSLFSFRGFLEV